MEQDKLLECIAKAESAAEAVKNADLRIATYEIVLRHLFNECQPMVAAVSTVPATVVPPVEQGEGPIKKISDWLGVSQDELVDFFEFQDGEALITMPLSKIPTKIADGQRFLALIQLAVNWIGYGVDSQPAKKIIDACKKYQCHDGNFASNIKDRDDWIESKGSAGTMRTYKLRRPGTNEALKELKIALNVQ